MSEIMKRIDEDFGEIEYYKEITLKLRFVSMNDGIVEEINENSVMELLNDKAFDGLGYWEEIE